MGWSCRNSNVFPTPISNLIAAFERLPGVGPKTAERFTLYLLKAGRGETTRLTRALDEILRSITSCTICHNFSVTSPCERCTDMRRDQKLLCVVAESADVEPIEATGIFKGRFHVLRGLIDPVRDVQTTHLKIDELVTRVKNDAAITEIIFALSPTIEGETTMRYIAERLARPHLVITRLATGLPSGGLVEYADEVTLGNALRGRNAI